MASLRQTLTSQWLKAVTSGDTAPMEKIAALNGLMAMIGSEQTLTVVGTQFPILVCLSVCLVYDTSYTV